MYKITLFFVEIDEFNKIFEKEIDKMNPLEISEDKKSRQKEIFRIMK